MNLRAHRDEIAALLASVASGIDIQTRTYDELAADGTLASEGLCIALVSAASEIGSDGPGIRETTLRWTCDVWIEQRTTSPEDRALDLLSDVLHVLANGEVAGNLIDVTGFQREGAETQSTCRYMVTFEYLETEYM